MLRGFDFSTWQGVLTTIGGLLVVTVLGMGIRILMMLTLQQRQQRMNRQINERLRSLMAAYKVLGGSFTGRLSVDPTHLRALRQRLLEEGADAETTATQLQRQERMRQMRDQVEAALADIILLGTEAQVRLAATAAQQLAQGQPIETAALVISLRDYIRKALDLGPVPAGITIPNQGPTRPPNAGGGRSGRSGGERPGGGGLGGDGGGGMGMGMGMGTAMRRRSDDDIGPA